MGGGGCSRDNSLIRIHQLPPENIIVLWGKHDADGTSISKGA